MAPVRAVAKTEPGSTTLRPSVAMHGAPSMSPSPRAARVTGNSCGRTSESGTIVRDGSEMFSLATNNDG